MGLFTVLLFIGLIGLFLYFRNANRGLTNRLNKVEKDWIPMGLRLAI